MGTDVPCCLVLTQRFKPLFPAQRPPLHGYILMLHNCMTHTHTHTRKHAPLTHTATPHSDALNTPESKISGGASSNWS